jgi:hypothetical protein
MVAKVGTDASCWNSCEPAMHGLVVPMQKPCAGIPDEQELPGHIILDMLQVKNKIPTTHHAAACGR